MGSALRLGRRRPVKGYAERIEPRVIAGWAFDQNRRPVRLEVQIKQERFELKPTWSERADVAAEHGQDFLYCGFSCEPSPLLIGALKAAIETGQAVRILANDVELKSPKFLGMPSAARALSGGASSYADPDGDLLRPADVLAQLAPKGATDALVVKGAPATDADTLAAAALTAAFDRFVMLVRQQCELGAYERAIALLDSPECLEHVPSPNLEVTLLRLTALIATRQWSAVDPEQVIAAFLWDFHASQLDGRPAQRGGSVESILLELYRHLATCLAADDLGDAHAKGILTSLALPLAHWTHRLTQNAYLALDFLELLDPGARTVSPRERLFAVRLYRSTGRNAKALALLAEHRAEQDDAWYLWHELGVLLRLHIHDNAGLSRSQAGAAIAAFTRAERLNPQQALSRREGWGLLRECFDNLVSVSRRLVDSGDLREGIRRRQEGLSKLVELSCELQGFHPGVSDPLRDSWVALGHRKILLWGSRDLYQCHYYRVREKIDQAGALGLETDYLDLSELPFVDWRRRLMGASLLYACRVPVTMTELQVFAYAKSLGIPIIYDIDDLIFDPELFPPPLETYAGTIDRALHQHLSLDNPFFGTAFGFADHCSVSTQPLADEVKRYLRPEADVSVLPNLLSEEVFERARKSARKKRANRPGQEIRLFYGSATKAHKLAFYDLFLPAALELLRAYPALKLYLVGYFDNLPSAFVAAGRIQLLDPTPDYLSYLDLVQGADINVAVLEPSRVTDAKSEIKWLEAAAFGIPSVVSPTAAYRQALVEGETVLFAETVEDWQRQLERLIQDRDLRTRIGRAARDAAFARFSPAVGERQLGKILKPYLPAKKARAKKRILLVNVYFAPQSIGGATRVMETQVRGLMEHYADEYEVFVLTTQADHDPARPYHVDQYWYEGVLVTRLEVPSRDWATHEDGKIQAFCEEFFRSYEFDLIHLHSIQMLTASVAVAALACNIPYVVTLHDAWWLSPYLFLVDESGALVDHTDPMSGGVSRPKGDSAHQRLTRAGVLQRLLKSAAAVLAVSETFAALYREAGVSNVRVHENVSEPLKAVETAPRTDDRIVLGYVGGISRHKGYHLLRDAITEGDFPQFRLLVVDHALNPGESYATHWGRTEVCFIPKVEQSRVAELYAQIDVLIAPSIWPESYGLVTREALKAGLWVIASNRGAIGDCIEDDVSGNLFEPSDAQSFQRVLLRLPQALAGRRPPRLLVPELRGNARDPYVCSLVDVYRESH
ncbi:hypothetical protein CKO23_04375 [Thiocystis violacea]|nr:hypothetical protein [Thiocystis violacea]